MFNGTKCIGDFFEKDNIYGKHVRDFIESLNIGFINKRVCTKLIRLGNNPTPTGGLLPGEEKNIYSNLTLFNNASYGALEEVMLEVSSWYTLAGIKTVKVVDLIAGNGKSIMDHVRCKINIEMI